MKRTTIFLEEQLERELQALARRQGRPMAGVVREAVEQYVVGARTAHGAAPRGFVALGRSGQHDTADRHEDLLWKDLPDPRGTGGTPSPTVKRRTNATAPHAKGPRRPRT
jgi:predicted transcriptional regulator